VAAVVFKSSTSFVPLVLWIHTTIDERGISWIPSDTDDGKCLSGSLAVMVDICAE